MKGNQFMEKRKITMQDIANMINVSKNTVSLALSGKEGVSEETRELIVSLAYKLGYKAPSSRKDKSANNNILVLIPEYIRDDRYFYNDIYWSIDNYSAKSGLNTIMAIVTPDLEEQNLLPKICSEIQFLGAMIIGILKESYVQNILNRYQNVVSIDHCYYTLPMPCVVTANIDGAYVLTRKLIEKGHREIGFIGSTSMTSSIYERWCGFNLCMQEAGLKVNDSYNITQDSPLGILLSNPDELTAIIKDMPKLPTAFICGGDRIAIACIAALKNLGLRVPEDISVVGFDDIEIGQYISPKLTTMHVKRHHMAKEAVSELLKMTRKQISGQKICLYPEYVERESLGQCGI